MQASKRQSPASGRLTRAVDARLRAVNAQLGQWRPDSGQRRKWYSGTSQKMKLCTDCSTADDVKCCQVTLHEVKWC